MELTAEQQRRNRQESIARDIARWGERARAQFMGLCDARPAKVPALAEAIRAGRIEGGITWEEQTACGCVIGTIAYAGENAFSRVYFAADQLREEVGRDTSSLECLLFSVQPGDTPESHPVLALLASWLDEWTKKNPNGCAPV